MMDTAIVDAIVVSYLDAAIAAYGTYPTDSLGSFAMDTQAVIHADAELRARFDLIDSEYEARWFVTEDCATATELAVRMAYRHDNIFDIGGLDRLSTRNTRVLAEVCFYWNHAPQEDVVAGHGSVMLKKNIITTSFERQPDKTWFDRLEVLYGFPAALPYFEAGIFDVSIISKAIEDSVDADILLSAMAVSR